MYNNRYTIERKLGWGHFSTVWLASDSEVPVDHPHKLVALKIQKSASHYTETARDEIDLLQRASKEFEKQCNEGGDDMNYVIQLLDHFMLFGPHGKHVCLVMTTCGPNLLHLIRHFNYNGIPAYRVKVMTRQLLLGLKFLHEKCQIIHTDLKPENFLMTPREPWDLEEVQYKRQIDVLTAKIEQLKAEAQTMKNLAGISAAFPSLGASSSTAKVKSKIKGKGSMNIDATIDDIVSSLESQPQGLTKSQKKKLKAKGKEKENDPTPTDESLKTPSNLKNEMDEAKSVSSEVQISSTPDVDIISTKTLAIQTQAPIHTPLSEEIELEQLKNKYVALGYGPGQFPWTIRKANRTAKFTSLSPYERCQLINSIKVSDLGNACWVHKHFTDDVTTRQYRSPEVIVRFKYSTPIDIWSVACIVFELVVGDYLFDPKPDPAGKYTRHEDHLALMMELVSTEFPKRLLKYGADAKLYFAKNMQTLKSIKSLVPWSLKDVVFEKYDMTNVDAIALADFLNPMLVFDPANRVTAAESAEHPWLSFTPHDFFAMYLDEEKEQRNKEKEKGKEKEKEKEKEEEKGKELTQDREQRTGWIERLPALIHCALIALEADPERKVHQNERQSAAKHEMLVRPYSVWLSTPGNTERRRNAIAEGRIHSLPIDFPVEFWAHIVRLHTAGLPIRPFARDFSFLKLCVLRGRARFAEVQAEQHKQRELQKEKQREENNTDQEPSFGPIYIEDECGCEEHNQNVHLASIYPTVALFDASEAGLRYREFIQYYVEEYNSMINSMDGQRTLLPISVDDMISPDFATHFQRNQTRSDDHTQGNGVDKNTSIDAEIVMNEYLLNGFEAVQFDLEHGVDPEREYLDQYEDEDIEGGEDMEDNIEDFGDEDIEDFDEDMEDGDDSLDHNRSHQ